jgi:hypothetical protein
MANAAYGDRASGLRFRTPEQYLLYARKLQRAGDPRADRAMKAAALAYGIARAAERGDMQLVQRGFEGLRAMGDAPVTLTREQIAAKFAALAQAQVSQNMEMLRTANTVVGVVVTALQAAGAAISNPQDQAAYRAVLTVIQFAVSRAAGGTATLPSLSSDAVAGLRGFCAAWVGVAGAVQSGITTLADSYAIRDRSAAAAIQTLGNIVIGVANGLCADPQINPGTGGTRTAAAPSNCPTLACERGYEKTINTTTNQCECVAIPPAQAAVRTPQVTALANYRQAVTSRKLVEMAIANPTVAPPFGSRGIAPATLDRMNCVSSCTLRWAGREAARVLGSIPSIPGTPATQGPVAFFDPATAPLSCNCAGVELLLPGRPVYDDSSGGGSATVAVGGALAVGALWYFFR